MVPQTCESNLKLARDRNLTNSILHQLQSDHPALLRRWLVVTVAKQIESDVETIASLIFFLIMTAAHQEFGGCGKMKTRRKSWVRRVAIFSCSES